jgi:hypothetical protein
MSSSCRFADLLALEHAASIPFLRRAASNQPRAVTDNQAETDSGWLSARMRDWPVRVVILIADAFRRE